MENPEHKEGESSKIKRQNCPLIFFYLHPLV